MSFSKANIRGLILLHPQSFVSFVSAKEHNGIEEIHFTDEVHTPKTILFKFYE